MITTGIIKRINVDSKNYSNNKYIVEISLFKSVNDITTDKYTYEANACVPPGLFSPYEIGDKVYIGFINGRGGLPVILGKIYQGLTEEDRAYALYNTLKVTQKVELPLTTTIGNITGQDLKDWKTKLDLLSYNNENTSVKTVLALSPVTNLHGFTDARFSFNDVTFEAGTTTISAYQILYEAKESLTKIQSQLFMTKKATLRSVVKTGIAGSISDCKKVQDLENQYMTCLEQISMLEKQVSPTSSQKLSN